jgi:hypothetical protein
MWNAAHAGAAGAHVAESLCISASMSHMPVAAFEYYLNICQLSTCLLPAASSYQLEQLMSFPVNKLNCCITHDQMKRCMLSSHLGLLFCVLWSE